MNDAINFAAIIVLAIGAIGQQRALRRLRRDHRALRRHHVEALVWYGALLARPAHRPSSLAAIDDSRTIR